MKYLFTIIVVLFSIVSKAQPDLLPDATSRDYFRAGFVTNQFGIVPNLEINRDFVESNIHFGMRVGFVLQYEPYWYLQNYVRYNPVMIVPFWLRAYSKEVGYQTPSSIVFVHELRNLTFEYWVNHQFNNKITDLQIAVRYTMWSNKDD
jgi:hypothetical protein